MAKKPSKKAGRTRLTRQHLKTFEQDLQKAKKLADKLPKMFQGAEVVRGLGIFSDDLEKHLDRNAMDQFDATRDMWVVVQDTALEDLDDTVEVKGFATKEDALVFARARSNGNINHRILRVTEQMLVVATRNSL